MLQFVAFMSFEQQGGRGGGGVPTDTLALK